MKDPALAVISTKTIVTCKSDGKLASDAELPRLIALQDSFCSRVRIERTIFV